MFARRLAKVLPRDGKFLGIACAGPDNNQNIIRSALVENITSFGVSAGQRAVVRRLRQLQPLTLSFVLSSWLVVAFFPSSPSSPTEQSPVAVAERPTLPVDLQLQMSPSIFSAAVHRALPYAREHMRLSPNPKPSQPVSSTPAVQLLTIAGTPFECTSVCPISYQERTRRTSRPGKMECELIQRC